MRAAPFHPDPYLASKSQPFDPVKRLLVLAILTSPLFTHAAATEPALAKRMDQVSAQFIGRPYIVDPLGEGDRGHFDRDPRFRLDGFDCTTFVETVLSISKARRSSEVPKWMDKIRYEKGVVGFETRNHFPDADWIANNVRARLVKDVTAQVAKTQPSSLAWAVALIEKDEWYKLLPIERLSGIPENEKAERLEELHSLSVNHGKSVARVPYLVKTEIVAHPELLLRIPHGSIINVVRPNFDVTKVAGTHMNITHQGFAFQRDGVVYFRHASPKKDPATGQGRVYETPLLEYVQGTLATASIGGINILSVR